MQVRIFFQEFNAGLAPKLRNGTRVKNREEAWHWWLPDFLWSESIFRSELRRGRSCVDGLAVSNEITGRALNRLGERSWCRARWSHVASDWWGCTAFWGERFGAPVRRRRDYRRGRQVEGVATGRKENDRCQKRSVRGLCFHG
jgi:hypothetical protein